YGESGLSDTVMTSLIKNKEAITKNLIACSIRMTKRILNTKDFLVGKFTSIYYGCQHKTNTCACRTRMVSLNSKNHFI
ncbi:TPA: hypothetical protein ACT9BX_001308, partial [Legionella pneumophila]